MHTPMASTTTIFIMLVPVLTMRIVARKPSENRSAAFYIACQHYKKYYWAVSGNAFGVWYCTFSLPVCLSFEFLEEFGDVNYKVAYM